MGLGTDHSRFVSTPEKLCSNISCQKMYFINVLCQKMIASLKFVHSLLYAKGTFP